MKTQDIRNMALALQAVEEASKKKMDPVGREDGDIDNDGDKDKSDSYLHNRRKAISSAIKGKGTKETVTVEEVQFDEAKLPASQRDRLDDLILNVHTTTHPEYDGNDTPQKYLKAIEKEFGAKIAKQVDDGIEKVHWGRDNRSGGNDKLASRQWSSKFKGGPRVTAAGKMNKQDVSALKTRIKNDKKFGGLLKSVKLPEETSWPVFARIQEKVNQTKGATKPESMEDRFTASDKKMVDGHGGIGKKTPQDFVDDDQIDKNSELFNASNVKVAPKRHNDQNVGDKTMPKAK